MKNTERISGSLSPSERELKKTFLEQAHLVPGGATCAYFPLKTRPCTCPMCQINVEAYQKRVNKEFGTSYRVPALFFTQLLGLALGCPEEELGLQRNVIPLKAALAAMVA